MELNPNHPVTQAVHEHWHTICALLMFQQGKRHVVITSELISAFERIGCAAVTIREDDAGLHLRIVDHMEAERLARKEGGLPT